MVYKAPVNYAIWSDEARAQYMGWFTTRHKYANQLAEAHDRECEIEERQLKRRRTLEHDEVEGIALLFGVEDAYGTTWHPGCMAKARPSQVKYYFEHEPKYGPVAAVTLLYEIERKELPLLIQRRYETASGGLVCVRKYFEDPKTNGPEAADLLKNGTTQWLSVSCTPMKSRTRQGEDGKKILSDVYEAKLVEVSDCSRPGAVPGVMAMTGNWGGTLLQGQYKRWEV